MNILYELSLWVLAIIALPRMLYNFFVYKKYRNSFWARIGLKDQGVKRVKPFVIWIHAVSLGETKAVAKLAHELRKRFPDSQFIISSVTETGFAEAQRAIPFADNHIYMPFDFAFIIKALVRKIKPDAVILCESDLWYNFLYESKKAGAFIALVNGKLSERSERRFRRVPFFSKRLFNLVDVISVQNNLYRQRFHNSGAEEKKLHVTGNLKLDDECPILSEQEIINWKKSLGIMNGQQVIAIGSTHAPEEISLLNILKPISHEFDVKILLVPRHPERFNEVATILQKGKIPFTKWSTRGDSIGSEKVILVDTMGVLRTCYQISDIAIVAGSFSSKVGGHNILEPCWYGKPVLYGPYMHTQQELVELMKQYGAGRQVEESELASVVREWLQNPLERDEIGSRGRQLLLDSKGSTQRTLMPLEPILNSILVKN